MIKHLKAVDDLMFAKVGDIYYVENKHHVKRYIQVNSVDVASYANTCKKCVFNRNILKLCDKMFLCSINPNENRYFQELDTTKSKNLLLKSTDTNIPSDINVISDIINKLDSISIKLDEIKSLLKK